MMKSQAFDGFQFPQRPPKQYQTAPIYLEPMQGSGERITVAGVVVGKQETLIESLIASDTAEALYGSQGKNLLALADMIIADLGQHLTQHPLKKWQPALSGTTLGKVQSARADNAKHALAQIAQLHASLCRLPALMALEDDEQEQQGKDNTLKAWIKQVQSHAIAKYPDLQAWFNVKETLSHGDSVILHYARQPLAANIGLVTPANMNSRINDAKIKLWNLDHLPAIYSQRRLILGIPRNDAPEMADDKVKNKVLDKIDALCDEAQKSRIDVQTTHTADEAAELLAA